MGKSLATTGIWALGTSYFLTAEEAGAMASGQGMRSRLAVCERLGFLVSGLTHTFYAISASKKNAREQLAWVGLEVYAVKTKERSIERALPSILRGI